MVPPFVSSSSHPPAPPSPPATRRFGGVLVRRPVWIPSWRGWLLLLALLGLAVFGLVRGVHGFLAVNDPASADVLVIEAWVPDYALKQGMELAAARNCRLVILAGGTVKSWPDPEAEDTYPRVAIQRIKRLGLNVGRVRIAESTSPSRDRTYASAMAVGEQLEEDGISAGKIDVLTMGAHSRRSRLLFQKALGPNIEVGIISIPNREYDADHWWRYSEGVKEVLSEGAAYLYARFLFHPE